MTSEPPFPEPTRPTDIARLDLARLRVETGPLDHIFRHFTEVAAQCLEVPRVSLWLLVDSTLRCVDLFDRPAGTHSAGSILQIQEFPGYFEALQNRRTLPAEVAPTDPRTRALAQAYLNPLGITSLLAAPLYIGGQITGVLNFEHLGPPREWTTEQRDFASAAADLLSLKIRAAEAEELKATLRTQALQLSETWRTGELAQTAAGIAHDFNNILNVILGLSGLIRLNPACPPALADLARQIEDTGQRGAVLARALMDFAHPAPCTSQVIRPADTIASLQTVLRSAVGSRHTLQFEIRATTGQVLIDCTLLERVVFNLVLNARDAMPTGGVIQLIVDSVSALDEIGQPGEFILLSIRDHGTGIAPETLPRIFEPFFTTKPRGQGTGVGLAVVHQIITQAGGFIRVESVLGQGTTFRIYLPRVSSS